MPADTLPEILRPLMQAQSIRMGHCAICGRPRPLNQHHIVRRGAGKLYRAGVEVPKPTITLCGMGNHLMDADGRYLCHGLAHHEMLHFRWNGRLEYLRTSEPVEYAAALEMDGWRRVWCMP